MEKKTKFDDTGVKNPFLSLRMIINTGLSFALTVSILDVIIDIVSAKPGALSSFALVFLPISVTLVILFLVYFVLCLLLIPLANTFFNPNKHAFIVSLAVFIGFLFLLASPSGLLELYGNFSKIITFLLFLIVILLLAMNGYLITRKVLQKANASKVGVTITLFMPFLFLITLIYFWIPIYQPEWVRVLTKEFIFILLLLMTQGMMYLIYRISNRIKCTILMALVVGIFIISGLTAAVAGTVRPKTKLYTKGQVESSIKRVLLITVDTLRPDYLSCYNPDANPTPSMDDIALDGILFKNAYAPSPWTLPSFCSIMTGLPPLVHQATSTLKSLPDTLVTMAEHMQKAGYYTNVIGRSPYFHSKYNVLQGFLETNVFNKLSIGLSFGSKFLYDHLAPKRFQYTAMTDELTNLAIEWINKNSSKEFFFWLHYFDPHAPYTPPNKYLPPIDLPTRLKSGFNLSRLVRLGYYNPNGFERECIEILYGGEILYVDDCLGQLFSFLKNNNLYDDTLIIISSDHGEELFERGIVGHGQTLYNEQIHVPLIIKLPGMIDLEIRNKFVHTKVSILSIMPTILELCGISNGTTQVRTKSLIPLFHDITRPYHEQPIISTSPFYYEDSESVIFDNYKYIRSLFSDHKELYNLNLDADERYTIDHQDPERLEMGEMMLDLYNQYCDDLGVLYGIKDRTDVELDSETLKRLETLGYIR